MRYYKRPFTERKLGTVIPDPQALDEAECATEPFNCLAHIRVGQFGDDHGGRHGTIPGHHSSSLKWVATYPDPFTGCNLFDTPKYFWSHENQTIHKVGTRYFGSCQFRQGYSSLQAIEGGTGIPKGQPAPAHNGESSYGSPMARSAPPWKFH